MEAYTKSEYIEDPKILPLSKDHVKRMARNVAMYLEEERSLRVQPRIDLVLVNEKSFAYQSIEAMETRFPAYAKIRDYKMLFQTEAGDVSIGYLPQGRLLRISCTSENAVLAQSIVQHLYHSISHMLEQELTK